MCELIVSVEDSAHPHDPVLCARRHKRGDVIEVLPDGHPWSERELANCEAGRWRLLKLPLVTGSEASAFTSGGRVDVGSGKLPTIRGFFLDLDGLPEDTSALAFADLAKLRRARVRPDDPRHVGPNIREIGR